MKRKNMMLTNHSYDSFLYDQIHVVVSVRVVKVASLFSADASLLIGLNGSEKERRWWFLWLGSVCRQRKFVDEIENGVCP